MASSDLLIDTKRWGYRPTEQIAITGNCVTFAHSTPGSLDLLSLGACDEPTSVLSELDSQRGGRLLICPVGLDLTRGATYSIEGNTIYMVQGDIHCSVQYVPETAIVETVWTTPDGTVTVSKFAPLPPDLTFNFKHFEGGKLLNWFDILAGYTCDDVNLITGKQGKIDLVVQAWMTPGYADPDLKKKLVIDRLQGGFRFSAGTHHIGLATVGVPEKALEIKVIQDTINPKKLVEGQFTISEGGEAVIVLGAGRTVEAVKRLVEQIVPQHDWHEELKHARDTWTSWSRQSTYSGPHEEMVRRSLITLKLSQFLPTGAFIAALGFSIAAGYGTERCWDYRYAWVRDGSETGQALLETGHFDEVAAWLWWLATLPTRGEGDDKRIGLMYTVRQQTEMRETAPGHLEGHMRSRIVRYGNAAVDQHQPDSPGYAAKLGKDALEQGLFEQYPIELLQRFILLLIQEANYTAGHWRERDHSLWEMRGEKDHYTSSKGMSGVVLKSAIEFFEELKKHPALLEQVSDLLPSRGERRKWRSAFNTLLKDIERKGYNKEKGIFTMVFEEEVPEDPRQWPLGADLLLLALMGLIDPNDPRMVRTTDAITEVLTMWPNRLVRRHNRDDNLPGREAGWLICTGWLAQVRAMQGEMEEARLLLQTMLMTASALGLMAEQFDPEIKWQTGNPGQAFSHQALVRTVCAIQRAERLQAKQNTAAE